MSEAKTLDKFNFDNTKIAEDWLVEAQASKLMESGGLCGPTRRKKKRTQRKCNRVVAGWARPSVRSRSSACACFRLP